MGLNGIILVDKPCGWTSHDVVGKLRGILHERRIGHSGTLDPMATGLLAVFVGRATRAVEFAEADSKEYIAGLRLGVSTDTQDITGNTLKSSNSLPSRAELEQALGAFKGEISQIPPMYSAIKVGGKKLYELARRGESVERKPRKITIDMLDIIGENDGDYILDIVCSKGTYIRTLCHDIGEKLGCHGCMDKLLRTRVERFCVEDSLTLSQIETIRDEERLEEIIIPIDRMFDEEPAVHLNEELSKAAHNGNALPLGVSESKPAAGQKIRVYDADGAFVGLYQYDKERDRQYFRLLKMFYEK